jgi:apolipoprotein N-acyltransferase
LSRGRGWSGPLRWSGALLAGALLPLSMAPFDWWPLGLISVAAWFFLLMNDPGRGLLLGWLYGVGKYGVGVSWVYVSIHEHGGAPPILAGLLVVLFASGMALFSLANGWLFGRFKSHNWIHSGGVFLVLLIAFEWLLTWFLSGFPWLAIGYGQLASPLAGFAPLGGVMLVSFMAAASAVAAVLLVKGLTQRPRSAGWKAVAGSLLIVVLLPWLIGGLARPIAWTEAGAEHTAALVQGNVAQASKWLPENRLPIIEHYQELSEPHWGVDLILWPEAALTVFEHQAGELFEALDARGKAAGTGLIFGIPSVEKLPGGEVAFLNTAAALGTAQGRYVKRRLVPFGEYVPAEALLRGLIRFFDLPMSHAVAGAWQQAPLKIGEARASMAICYEIVYPELVRDEVEVLLTISNDTWFGDSLGPLQHLAIARMRALENGRWLLRATNNGVTAIVDAAGGLRGHLPQFQVGVLTGTYRTMTGRTPFNRFGHWPLYIVLLVMGAGLLILRKPDK